MRTVIEGDDQTVYFAPTVDSARVAFRQSGRVVDDTPMMELAGLARVLDVANKFDDEAVIGMRDALEASRVGAPIRARLMAAIRLARQAR